MNMRTPTEETTSITVLVNGKSVALSQGQTLSDLVDQLGLGQSACATAVNGQFVSRASRQTLILKSDDHVMTFEPITGG